MRAQEGSAVALPPPAATHGLWPENVLDLNDVLVVEVAEDFDLA